MQLTVFYSGQLLLPTSHDKRNQALRVRYLVLTACILFSSTWSGSAILVVVAPRAVSLRMQRVKSNGHPVRVTSNELLQSLNWGRVGADACLLR